MTRVIFRGTGPIALMGTRDSCVLEPGTRIDLDRVIGDRGGQPETVRDQLGPHVALCVPEPVESPTAAVPAPTSRRASRRLVADTTKEPAVPDEEA